MTCPICKEQPAILHSAYGYLPCESCQDRRRQQSKPARQVEFTSTDIKQQRKSHLKSIIQPWRSGELSKEYLDLHGRKNINVTDAEVAKAKNVWTDLSNMENVKKTT